MTFTVLILYMQSSVQSFALYYLAYHASNTNHIQDIELSGSNSLMFEHLHSQIYSNSMNREANFISLH
jgi:hypothetical protein